MGQSDDKEEQTEITYPPNVSVFGTLRRGFWDGIAVSFENRSQNKMFKKSEQPFSLNDGAGYIKERQRLASS